MRLLPRAALALVTISAWLAPSGGVSMSDFTGVVPTLQTPPVRKGVVQGKTSPHDLKLRNSLSENITTAAERLLVVGAGALGKRVIERYRNESNQVVALTRSTRRHEHLKRAGAEPVAVEHLFPEEIAQEVDNVVFLVPPTGSRVEYMATLKSALKKWGGQGRFVFASSTGVFPQRDGEVCDEQSSSDPSASQNAPILLEAEQLVLAAGGTVLRFAGLYSLEPGEGSFFLQSSPTNIRSDRILNLVSYVDAAAAVLKVLECGATCDGQIFIISDGKDMTMREIYRAASSTQQYSHLPSLDPAVEGSSSTAASSQGPVGRRFQTAKARLVLGWEPAFPSFEAYCTDWAQREAGQEKGDEVGRHEGVKESLTLRGGGTPNFDAAVQRMLDSGADVNTASIDGMSALLWACKRGRQAAASALVDRGADVNVRSRHNSTALMLASWGGLDAVVRQLLEGGAKVDAKNDKGSTALIWACRRGRREAAKLLVERGADVNAKNEAGNTALMWASWSGHQSVATMLAEADADVNARNQDGFTPLALACWNGHQRTARALVEAGADVNAKNNAGLTPLMWACWCGPPEEDKLVKLLVEHGADVDAQDSLGRTPLMWACRRGNEAAARLLLQHGANANGRSKNGQTALMWACWGGRNEIAKLLVAEGVDINAKDGAGYTPPTLASLHMVQ